MNKDQCLGGGVLLGVLVATGINGTLSPSPYNKEKPVVEQDHVISSDVAEKEVYLTQEQAERLYPSLRADADAFTTNDTTVLRSLFTLSQRETLPEHNLCHYDTFSGKQQLTEGTCVFLSPQLALTNYHVATTKDPEYLSEFYTLKSLVRAFDGKKYSVQTLAVSPRYDLALIKITGGSSAKTLSLGYYDQGLSQTVFSFDDKGKNMETYTSEGSLRVESRSLLLENGMFGPPAFVLPRLYFPGNSGSPVFQEGRLVGLVSYVDERDKKTFVVPDVRSFISEILATVDGE